MVLRNIIEVDEEKPLFQLFFLKDDENQRALRLKRLRRSILEKSKGV